MVGEGTPPLNFFVVFLTLSVLCIITMDKKPSIYHRTSIEAAKTSHTTISRVGQKRMSDELHEPQTGTKKAVLAGVSSNMDFRRPGLVHSYLYPALQAGEVLDVAARGLSEHLQRESRFLTPTSTSEPFLDLSHSSYGLPRGLVDNFAALGIKSIYPWQAECLLRSRALEGKRNLVYSAPTGGGKSLVADILMLKKVIESPGKKAMLVLPYVALVQEKVRWLRKVVEGLTKSVADSCHDERPSLWRKRSDEEKIRIVGFFGGSKSKASWVRNACPLPTKSSRLCEDFFRLRWISLFARSKRYELLGRGLKFADQWRQILL